MHTYIHKQIHTHIHRETEREIHANISAWTHTHTHTSYLGKISKGDIAVMVIIRLVHNLVDYKFKKLFVQVLFDDGLQRDFQIFPDVYVHACTCGGNRRFERELRLSPMYVYVYVHVCMYVCMHVCMYVCM